MRNLTHHDVVILLLSAAVLLAAARIFGEIARRFRQPAVLGELVAGIVLGPTLLGAFAPGAYAALFPREGAVAVALDGVTKLAITMFLLVAGLEVDLATVWRQGRSTLAISLAGLCIPFASGFALAWFFPAMFGAEPGSNQLVFALFFATAMSITALPVIAKILRDLNLFRSEVGLTIVAVAMFDDLIGWIVFAFVLALMNGAAAPEASAALTGALTLGFVVFMLTAGRWILNRVLPWLQANTTWPGGVLGFMLSGGLFCAAFTEWIGVHAVFGAFLFGIAAGDSRHLPERTRETVDQFVSFVFAPLFFACVGLRANFAANFDFVLVALVILVGSAGKILGCGLTARWAGFPRREAWAIGFGMNARGAMEIVLGTLAFNAGIIGERLFVALVMLALLTSITSGALIPRALGRYNTRPLAQGDAAPNQ